MDNTSSVNIPMIGMVTDNHSLNLDNKSYRHALNATVEGLDGQGFPVFQNDGSNVLAIDLPAGYKIIGQKVIIEQNRAIVAIVNPTTGGSQIIEFFNCSYTADTDHEAGNTCIGCQGALAEGAALETITQTPYCTYHTIIADNCLNFNINNPVDIEYKITDCTLNIYFTDNLNERRYLYFDYTDGNPSSTLKVQQHFFTLLGYSDTECKIPIYATTLDCNKIKYHPNYEKPCIDFVDLVGGGKLKSGSYQALFAYADVMGNPLTNYSPATQIIPIRTKDITVQAGYETDRAIKFTLTNIDQSGVFDYYNFVVAETIDGFTEFKLLGTFPVTTTTQTHTGNNPLLAKLTAGDIFFRRPYYRTAKSVTKSNDYLFFTGLTEFPKINLQPVAELIQFKWITVGIKESVYADPKNTFYFRGFMRDEVYPLGLVFEADNGEELCAIHVPGPSLTTVINNGQPNPLNPINNKDVIFDSGCDITPRNKAWEVYNTGKVETTAHLFTDNCDKIQEWETGDFAYWESTETYPNDPTVWGTLCGQKIRHHKFPDNCITHIHDGKDLNKPYTDDNIMFPMGVKVMQSSVITALDTALAMGIITQEQRNRVKRYRIVRGNRANHKSIIAKGLLYDVWNYNKANKAFYYSNYPYNDLRDDKFIANSDATYDTPDSPTNHNIQFHKSGRYTFHSPDTHFTNPKLGTELKLETLEYGVSQGFFNECLLEAKYKFLTRASYILSLAFGVAASLSATEEKECTTYNLKTDTKEYQGENGFSYVGEGGSRTNMLTAGTLAEASGTSGSSGNIDTHIDAHKKDTSVGERHEEYNNPYSISDPNYGGAFMTTYDTITGVKQNGQGNSKDLKVESFTKTTCKGTAFQELNKPGILTTLSGALGAGQKSLQGIIYQISLGLFEMKKVLDLLDSLVPKKNLAIQYNSVGKYNNYTCVPSYVGNKRRKIQKAVYLDSTIQSINESANSISQTFNTINFNNWLRESSVYIKLAYNNVNELFPSPTVVDNSRFLLSDVGGFHDLDKTYEANISSYYGSMKNYVPDQYGNIYNIEYLDTNSCSINLPVSTHLGRVSNYNSPIAFGGDTFINRFAVKRKVPFFTQTAFKRDDQADIRYEDLGNIGYPNYYFNTQGTLMENISSITNLASLLNPLNVVDLFGVPKNRLDTDTSKFFYQNGKIYLYSYGIPYFFVESDVNTDYRYGQDNADKDYYPHNTDLSTWLQEKNVPIRTDNFYSYDNSFSKQSKESVICINKGTFQPDKLCKTTYPSRIIYSGQNENNGSSYDNWLIFKANDHKDFPLTNGDLISADGIENDKVLVRFENTFTIFNAYNTIATDGDSIQVGTGGIFASRPKEFSSTELGHAGTQHRGLLRTEFGHIWVDAKRGQVFLLKPNAAALDEISNKGRKNWFKENLPFQIVKDFPIIDPYDTDNSYKGIGLHMSFDKRFSRFFLTKLDYKVTDARVRYDEATKEFFYRGDNNVKVVVSLNDTAFFCNKSWTQSFNFLTEGWVSYHSFLPNIYIDWIDYFQSVTDSKVWSHNRTNKSFQVFNGKLEPFSVEFQTKPTFGYNYLNSVEYMLDVIRYHNEYDTFYKDTVTFNKAIVFTNKECSGLLNLNVTDPNNMHDVGSYPYTSARGLEVEVTNSNGFWSFNQFHDCTVSQYNNLPMFKNNCANSNKELNLANLNYFKNDLDKSMMRGDAHNIILINDKESRYKFILKHVTNKSYKSLN